MATCAACGSSLTFLGTCNTCEGLAAILAAPAREQCNEHLQPKAVCMLSMADVNDILANRANAALRHKLTRLRGGLMRTANQMEAMPAHEVAAAIAAARGA